MTKLERARLNVFLKDTKLQVARIERNVRMQADLHTFVVDRKDREIARLQKDLAAARRTARSTKAATRAKGR